MRSKNADAGEGGGSGLNTSIPGGGSSLNVSTSMPVKEEEVRLCQTNRESMLMEEGRTAVGLPNCAAYRTDCLRNHILPPSSFLIVVAFVIGLITQKDP